MFFIINYIFYNLKKNIIFKYKNKFLFIMNSLGKLNPLRYFSGSNPAEAIQIAKLIKHQPIFNYFIEARPEITPQQMYERYNNLIKEVETYEHKKQLVKSPNNKNRVAIKLSSFRFHKDYIDITVKSFLNKGWQVVIDAENNANHTGYKTLTNNLISNYNVGEPRIIKTYQMYRRDAIKELCDDLDYYKCSHIENVSNKIHLGIKLVRGAYWKEDQHTGNLFTEKHETDYNYDAAMSILDSTKINCNVIIATHNKKSIDYLNYFANEKQHKLAKFEYAYLLGLFDEKEVDKLVNNSIHKNVYLPYGEYKYMLPYLIRRYYEVMM